jgi:hypothetical protein
MATANLTIEKFTVKFLGKKETVWRVLDSEGEVVKVVCSEEEATAFVEFAKKAECEVSAEVVAFVPLAFMRQAVASKGSTVTTRRTWGRMVVAGEIWQMASTWKSASWAGFNRTAYSANGKIKFLG